MVSTKLVVVEIVDPNNRTLTQPYLFNTFSNFYNSLRGSKANFILSLIFPLQCVFYRKYPNLEIIGSK